MDGYIMYLQAGSLKWTQSIYFGNFGVDFFLTVIQQLFTQENCLLKTKHIYNILESKVL